MEDWVSGSLSQWKCQPFEDLMRASKLFLDEAVMIRLFAGRACRGSNAKIISNH